MLPEFIVSSHLLLKTDIGLKHFFAHNVRYGNFVTFRIRLALEYLQYLDNHEPQSFEFCIECKPTDRTCQLYYRQVKMLIIYKGTDILVSGAFLKYFSIHKWLLALAGTRILSNIPYIRVRS